jgi:predicted ABC-type transport system involved in lysophospholipase L1 biosynthesis ATPase subunit
MLLEKRHAMDLLTQVGLGDRANTYPDKLSGGEQQRIASPARSSTIQC